jgi:flagellar biosynthesis protein FlhB
MAKDDRTEAPTPKRKRDARKKGQVARSADLVTWIQVLAATYAVSASFSLASKSLRRGSVEVGRLTANPDRERAVHFLATSLRDGLLTIGPLAGAMLGIAIVTNLAQTGMMVSPNKLKPSMERLSPVKGIKRLFSKQGLWEATKEMARASVLTAVAWRPLRQITEQLVAQQGPLRDKLGTVAHACIGLARSVAYAGILLAFIDFAVQKRRLLKSLKMTKQEVKDEYRQSEGDPQMKAQRKQRAAEMSRNRMMSDVKRATAVVINPTHIAVAIFYERSTGAPKVLAKGTGAVAARIREEAELHRVPVVRNVPLARALNALCEVGDQIPSALFDAVARLLAFVMRLGARSTGYGPLSMSGPSLIPEEILAQVRHQPSDQSRGARRAPKRRGQGRPRRNEVP